MAQLYQIIKLYCVRTQEEVGRKHQEVRVRTEIVKGSTGVIHTIFKCCSDARTGGLLRGTTSTTLGISTATTATSTTTT